jgi:hypothetical protein
MRPCACLPMVAVKHIDSQAAAFWAQSLALRAQ